MTETNLDGMMESIVFNELAFRYGRASVCSVDDFEIDFRQIPLEGHGRNRNRLPPGMAGRGAMI